MPTFPAQQPFGQFVAERFGPQWVYAARKSAGLKARYPDSVVITPMQQRQLNAGYRALYGREYDREHWMMLCALRAVARDLAYDDLPARVQDMVETALAAAEGRE